MKTVLKKIISQAWEYKKNIYQLQCLQKIDECMYRYCQTYCVEYIQTEIELFRLFSKSKKFNTLHCCQWCYICVLGLSLHVTTLLFADFIILFLMVNQNIFIFVYGRRKSNCWLSSFNAICYHQFWIVLNVVRHKLNSCGNSI